MGLKRYTASADTTIVNAFKPNLRTRATGANAGMADVLEVYSIYGRETTASQELSRILINFPVTTITADRTAGTIPSSGSVSFYLRMFNAPHSKTVPRDFKLDIVAVSQSWEEGVGLDLETYKDDTKGNTGANWMSASSTARWKSVGGDYVAETISNVYSQTLTDGLEDLLVDITTLVENWITGSDGSQFDNYGVGVRLSSSYEAHFSYSAGTDSGSVGQNTYGATKSYFTKRFFARGSQYFFKRPVIEARWDSTVKDARGDIYYSSSLAPAADNLNTVYLYNYIRGSLTNIPGVGTGEILVSLYSGSATNTAPDGPGSSSKVEFYDVNTNITGGYKSTGIYTASLAITAGTTPLTKLFDVWHSGSTEYFTGSIVPKQFEAAQAVSKPTYYMNITNLRGKYRKDETARFNLYIRNKNWSPTIYTVANSNPEGTTVVSASDRVYRVLDGYEAVPYGTGSDIHTQLSYDVSGNYFDFDMKLLEPSYAYAFKFAFYDSALVSWVEQPYAFKFRVEDYEY